MEEAKKGVAGRLRVADDGPGCPSIKIARAVGLEEPRCLDRGCCGCLGLVLSALADAIDAELAQARGESLRQGATVWAKASGWPDFRDGEGFGGWLDRCAVKRPCFEDGEPVQSSDMEEIGTLATCCVYMDGSWRFEPDKYEDERNPKPWDRQSGTKNDRVKCPEPEVLGADGMPIKEGETVWLLSGTGPHVVDTVYTNIQTPDGRDCPWADIDNDGTWAYVESLTHTPPDTQERIDVDARKRFDRYWGCEGAGCYECPAKIDGKTPKYRFGTDSCTQAIALDLLRRQREVCEKGGAE